LTSLFAAQPTAAQDSAALLSDPAGDVQLLVAGTPTAPDSAAAYSGADLRSLAIAETRTEFTFTITVEDLKPAEQDSAADGISISTYFTHNGREFRLEMIRSLPAVDATFYGYLNARDSANAEWNGLWFTGTEVRGDVDADTLSVTIPRDMLADAEGALPFPGRSLEGIHVKAGSTFQDAYISVGNPVPRVEWPANPSDDLPDDAAAAATYPIALGVAQSGHAFLSSQTPFRASNGEATTYILTAVAENLGDAADRFTFAVAGASSRITVVVPVQVLALEGKASHEVPVLVTVPFGHQHGDTESFILEMTSESDPGSVGRVEMGVRFLAVPQPAGHHDTLYLHGGATQGGVGPLLNFRAAFMSTLEEDPFASPGNYYSTSQGGGPGRWTYYYYYRLHPGLQLGLDFDLARTGRLVVPVGTTEPMLGTTMAGELYVYSTSAQDSTRLAILPAGEPADIQANSQHLFETEFDIEKEADSVPYVDGQEMYLNLRISTLSAVPTFGIADTGAYIAEGGSLRLPLNEWHDDVDQVLAALAGPGLSPLGEQERLVNPGEAAIFEVSIANPSDKAVRVVLEVSGPNTAWAALPSTQVEIPAHDTGRASIVVRAPAAAVSGERADLVLQAFSKDDPAARGLLRLVTIVDTDVDHPDDTAAAQALEPKESPTPSAALLLALVALLAVGLRRRP
jgi:hypothetical protein